MDGFNHITLVGNLTRDPQVRFLPNEKAVADFGLAINRRWKNADGVQQEAVMFVDIKAWGRSAETAAQYLKKGSSVLVDGRLDMDTWDDKESGKKRSKLFVTADRILFLDRKEDRAEGAPPPAASAPPPARRPAPAAVPSIDEPPF